MKSSKRRSAGAVSPDLDVYCRALEIADRDSLHDVIARKGFGILGMGLPYVLVAARWNLASKRRRDQRRERIIGPSIDAAEAPTSVWDPYERARRNEQLRTLLDTMGDLLRAKGLTMEDVRIVWTFATGYSDEDIRSRWLEWGFAPPVPSASALRKRRQRALDTIRQNVQARLTEVESE